MCVIRMCSDVTPVINIYHIQSLSCSKSGRTTLRLIGLAGLIHWVTAIRRVPPVTSFNCCVVMSRNRNKNAPTISQGGILWMRNFWGVMLCRCMIHSRIFEWTRFLRTVGSHSSKKTKSHNRSPESLECNLFYTLFYWSHFCDFVLTFFIWVNFRDIDLVEFWSVAIRKLYFPLPLLFFFCSSWDRFTLCSAKRFDLRYNINLAPRFQTVLIFEFFCKTKNIFQISQM
jgi:hypothetical protein